MNGRFLGVVAALLGGALTANAVEGDSYLGRTGTNVLARVREEISAIDKTGAGTLTFGNPYRIVGESRLREGTIRLPERPGNVGLWESVYVDMGKGPDVSGQSLWGSGKGDRIEDRIAAEDWHLSRDGARLVFSGYDNVVSNGITRATAAVYKGFLWSHAPTNETWQFAMHQTYRINMKLNGQWTPFGNSGEKSAANVWTTTVKPGPNPIVIYSLSANWYKRQDLSPRFDGLGLSYDPHPVAGETNAAHFVKLDDGGTGRLLTVNDQPPSEWPSELNMSFARLVCAEGTHIDLCGSDLEIGELVGLPRIVNGGMTRLDGQKGMARVTISGSWTPGDVRNGPLTVGAELCFEEDAVVLVPEDVRAGDVRVLAFAPRVVGIPVSSREGWRIHRVSDRKEGTFLVLCEDGCRPTVADCQRYLTPGVFAPAVTDAAFPNPLKGFRPDLYDAKNGTQGDYGRLVRFYIPWGDIESCEADGIEKIRAYCDEKFAVLPDSSYKVIPRIRIKNGSGKNGNVPEYSYPADMADKVDWEGDVWDGDVFTNRMVRLIERLGACWDNDPRIAWVQMGIYGAWGEHHTPHPSVEMQKLMADAFKRAFKHKKVIVRSADDFTDYDFGYYWDSWAHIQQWTSTGQGAANMKKRIDEGLYLTSPIEGETAYDWGNYATQPGDSPDDTLSDPVHADFLEMTIRRMHCTGLGWVARYHPTNDLIRAGAARIQKAFGYRYELGAVSFVRVMSPGFSFSVTGSVRNVGSAPFYYDWPLTVALLDPETRETVWQGDFSTDIRTWVPGDLWNETTNAYDVPAPTCPFAGTFRLPTDLAQGQYVLALGIRDPQDGKPSVRFAIESVAADRWHDLGTVTVIRRDLIPALSIALR